MQEADDSYNGWLLSWKKLYNTVSRILRGKAVDASAITTTTSIWKKIEGKLLYRKVSLSDIKFLSMQQDFESDKEVKITSNGRQISFSLGAVTPPLPDFY